MKILQINLMMIRMLPIQMKNKKREINRIFILKTIKK